MSTQDEEEVEEELAALEAEVARPVKAQRLPSVPDTQLPAQRVGGAAAPEPVERESQTERQAMLA